MDEAMYCDRIIVMHEGVALAEGAPAEMPSMITDAMYALEEHSLVMDYETIEQLPGVRSVQSFGDSLHLMTDPAVPEERIASLVENIAGHAVQLRRIEPSLEDVFIRLIREGAKHA
jgi:ABC-2 type transport system ATP-binding protein